MSATATIGVLWLAFAGSHLVLSARDVRAWLVARFGLQPFLGLYSLVALPTFIALAWVFATHKHAGPLLWTTLGPPSVAHVVNYALMCLAFAFFVCSVLPASSAPSGMAASGPARARGLIRVTRHPMLSAFVLFGVAHLLVNGALGDVLFFGGFPLFSWAGARHQDARKVHEVPGYDDLIRTTSFVPFAAILTGRQRLVASELPFGGLIAGVLVAVVVRHFHAHLFGPSPTP
jgi:uncharacterized membrane protein